MTPELPRGKFGVILADCPWSYQNWSDKKHGAARAWYECMTLEEICALPVGELAAEDCALALWVTGPKLAEGAHLRVMEAWGFRPVTTLFTWVKTTQTGRPYSGLGFYTRSGSEFVLLGVKGKKRRRKAATNVRQVVYAHRGRHSEKPRVFHEKLEELFEGPYVELFARERVWGWTGWGNQLGMDGAGAMMGRDVTAA